jgi:hypothetical protein
VTVWPRWERFQGLEPAQLLASSVHQATRLDSRAHEAETVAWVRYLTRHFPVSRNGERDAKVLWTGRRTRLLNDAALGLSALITHGQPAAHWLRHGHGRLRISLEITRSELMTSVDRFMVFLRRAPDRREVASERALRSSVLTSFRFQRFPCPLPAGLVQLRILWRQLRRGRQSAVADRPWRTLLHRRRSGHEVALLLRTVARSDAEAKAGTAAAADVPGGSRDRRHQRRGRELAVGRSPTVIEALGWAGRIAAISLVGLTKLMKTIYRCLWDRGSSGRLLLGSSKDANTSRGAG